MNHLLFANDDIVEQAFELRRNASDDKRRIGSLENAVQSQPFRRGNYVLGLDGQKVLTLQSANDFSACRRGADAFGFFKPVTQNLIADWLLNVAKDNKQAAALRKIVRAAKPWDALEEDGDEDMDDVVAAALGPKLVSTRGH